LSVYSYRDLRPFPKPETRSVKDPSAMARPPIAAILWRGRQETL
jgi:hypothetical protein